MLSIDYAQAHIAGERAKAVPWPAIAGSHRGLEVQELLKKGCRNPVVKRPLKEKRLKL